jgi:Fe2+ or Zn2+ uptake regulation protein
MSKPTPRQKQVIELVKKQCDYWLSTNDIHSPSHNTDIDEEISLLTIDDIITTEQGERVADVLGELWANIATIDERKPSSK